MEEAAEKGSSVEKGPSAVAIPSGRWLCTLLARRVDFTFLVRTRSMRIECAYSACVS